MFQKKRLTGLTRLQGCWKLLRPVHILHTVLIPMAYLVAACTYVMRTIPDIVPLLAPPGDAIRLRLIPALTAWLCSCLPSYS